MLAVEEDVDITVELALEVRVLCLAFIEWNTKADGVYRNCCRHNKQNS